jgi:hypothetical protein
MSEAVRPVNTIASPVHRPPRSLRRPSSIRQAAPPPWPWLRQSRRVRHEGKERVGCGNGPAETIAGLHHRGLHGVDTAHLAGADASVASAVEDDGVRLHRARRRARQTSAHAIRPASLTPRDNARLISRWPRARASVTRSLAAEATRRESIARRLDARPSKRAVTTRRFGFVPRIARTASSSTIRRYDRSMNVLTSARAVSTSSAD